MRELFAESQRIDRVLNEMESIVSEAPDTAAIRDFRKAIAEIRRKNPLSELARRLARH
jgi:hypothetical protein